MTLGEAQEMLRPLIWEPKGAICPLCHQHAQVYKWTLYSTAVRLLAELYKAGGTEKLVEAKRVKPTGSQGDGARLRYYGLAESDKDRRPDGGKSGWWQVTEFGRAFLFDRAVVRKNVWVYDNRVMRREGPPVRVRDALGKKFNYDEMMRGTL